MKAIVLNDHYVNSISKAIVVVPNEKQKTIELILTEDGRQDFRLSLDISNAKELRDTLISHIADFITPRTPKIKL